ncbi:MAG: methyl-accepting chemotaxis protein, partial [Candidatus Heimdallarchaeota archaeon]|nr:methyl-accepting chemotaxis protein [Candidatus Heimdallarchaeota archaeon]
ILASGNAYLAGEETEDITSENLFEQIVDKLEILTYKSAEELNLWFEERQGDLLFTIHNPFIQSSLPILTGDAFGNITEVNDQITTYFELYLTSYDVYSRVMIVNNVGEVIVWILSEELKSIMIERGENITIPADNYNNKTYVADARRNGHTDRIILTDIMENPENPNGNVDNTQLLLSHVIYDLEENILGTIHFSIDPSKLYEKIVFKDEAGNTLDDIYESFGLQVTGEQYLVQTGTNYLLSPSRFSDGFEGILETKVDTDGVENATKYGWASGTYLDYRDVEILGVGWNFQQDVHGSDLRPSELKAQRTSFNLPWILMSEIDFAEANEPVELLKSLIVKHFIITVLITSISIILIIGISFFISNSLTKDLFKLSSSMIRGSEGDLRIDDYELRVLGDISLRDDEIGELGRAYTRLYNSIREFVSSNKEAASILSATSEELVTVAEDINLVAEDVASTSISMAEGSGIQTAMISAINTDIDDIKKLIESILTNSDPTIDKLKKDFNKISLASFNILSVSEETAASAEEIAAAAEETTTSIEELTSSANTLLIQAENTITLINKFKI